MRVGKAGHLRYIWKGSRRGGNFTPELCLGKCQRLRANIQSLFNVNPSIFYDQLPFMIEQTIDARVV